MPAISILSAMIWNLGTDLTFLRTNYSDQVDTDLAINEYIDIVRELSTKQCTLTDKSIIQKVLGNSADVSSDEADMEVSKVKSIRKPLTEKVRRTIEMLEEFSLYSKFG